LDNITLIPLHVVVHICIVFLNKSEKTGKLLVTLAIRSQKEGLYMKLILSAVMVEAAHVLSKDTRNYNLTTSKIIMGMITNHPNYTATKRITWRSI
jgi:hypothetical protein